MSESSIQKTWSTALMATEQQILALHREHVEAIATEKRLQLAHRQAEEAMAQTGTAWHAAQAKCVAIRTKIHEAASQEAGQPRTPESKVEVKEPVATVDDNKPKPNVQPQPQQPVRGGTAKAKG